MKERLYTIVGMISSLFNPMLFFIGYRYLIICGSSLPLTLATFTLLPVFFVGLFYVISKVCKHNIPGLTEPGISYDCMIITAIMQGVYLCSTIYSLSFDIMSPRRYFILSCFFDMIFLLFLPCIFLSRDCVCSQAAYIVTSFLAYILHDFLAIDFGGSSEVPSLLRYYTDGRWKAFVCLLAGRLAFCFRGLFHKRMQIINHCAKKWQSTNDQLMGERRIAINRAYLDDSGNPCCRLVSTDSAVLAHAKYLRNMTEIKRASTEENKELEAINMVVDDYIKYLLDDEAISGKRKARIIQNLIKNDITQTGNSLYHHMFYLRNKISINDAYISHETLSKKKETFTRYKMCNVKDDPNTIEDKIKKSRFKGIGDKPLSEVTKEVLDEAQNITSNVHLFTGYNDLYLTRLDLMFSSQLFDTVLFEFSSTHHCLMYFLVTIFPTTIGCSLIILLNDEIPILKLINGYKVLFGSVSGIIVFVFFMMFLIVVPFINFYGIMAVPIRNYHWLELCISILWVSIGISFIEPIENGIFEILPNFTFLLAILVRVLYISKFDGLYYDKLNKSNVEAVKMALSKQFKTIHQLHSFTKRAHKIKEVLGASILNSLLLDSLFAEYFS